MAILIIVADDEIVQQQPITPEQTTAILKTLANPDDPNGGKKPGSDSGRGRRAPYNFTALGVEVGTVLEYIPEPERKVLTQDAKNQVRCLDDNEVMAISAAAMKFHPRHSTQDGYYRFRVAGENIPLYMRQYPDRPQPQETPRPDPGNKPTIKDPNTFAKLNIPLKTRLEFLPNRECQVETRDEKNQVLCLWDQRQRSLSAAALAAGQRSGLKAKTYNGFGAFARIGDTAPIKEPRKSDPAQQSWLEEPPPIRCY